MFTKVMEWGYLKSSPATSVKLFKEPPGRLRYLEAEEIEPLLAHYDDPHLPYLAMWGVSLEAIGALLGHKDPKMTKRYARLSPTSLQVAVTTLDNLQMGTKREQGEFAERG